MVDNKGQVAKVQLSTLILAPVNVLIVALYVMHVAAASLTSVVLSLKTLAFLRGIKNLITGRFASARHLKASMIYCG